MRFIFAFVASALLAWAPAFAADDMGFYVGAGIGEASVDADLGLDGVSDFDGSDTAFKVFGGWKPIKYLALELEYIDGGEATDKWKFDDGEFSEVLKASVSLSGFNASVVGILPIGEQFNVFGKLGFMFWDADGKLHYSNSLGEEERDKFSDSDNDFSWGIGAGFDFTENFGVLVEYQAFEISDADADMFSGSVVWRF